MVTLLASTFTRGPFLWGDGVFMSRCACGLCTCESMRRLSRNWITVGKPECTAFDFHWFKLCLIAVVILWVTHLCHVYSSCLSFVFFPLTKMVLSVSTGFFFFPYRHVHIGSPDTRRDRRYARAHMCQVWKPASGSSSSCVCAYFLGDRGGVWSAEGRAGQRSAVSETNQIIPA